MKENIKPKNLEHLIKIIKNEIDDNGYDCDLNHIDVSKITDFTDLFRKNKYYEEISLGDFCGDISGWDMSSAVYTQGMFMDSVFDGDISKWNMSKVKQAIDMFRGSKFNGDISEWDMSSLEESCYMFGYSVFNGDISKWDMSNLRRAGSMFEGSKFTGDISKWNISNVKSMNGMFCNSQFNGDISNWNVSKVKDMDYIFQGSQFNGDISKWNTKMLKSIRSGFKNSQFKGDISKWNTLSLQRVDNMFKDCDIYCDMSQWNIKNLEKLVMFQTERGFDFKNIVGAKSNVPLWAKVNDIDSWDVLYRYQCLVPKEIKTIDDLKVNIIFEMVNNGYNCDLNHLDVSKVENFSGLFSKDNEIIAQFNGDISGWDMSSARDLSRMFYFSKFEGDISKWNVSKVVDLTDIFYGTRAYCNLSIAPYWSKIENFEERVAACKKYQLERNRNNNAECKSVLSEDEIKSKIINVRTLSNKSNKEVDVDGIVKKLKN